MPTLDCPSGPVAGPVKTATDGALGLTPVAANHNARRDALEEAADELIDDIEDTYECSSNCRLHIRAPYQVGVTRWRGPARRAWWTFWLAYWSEATVSVTCIVECAE